MDDRTKAHCIARFVLRAVLLCAAAVVVLLIGSSTAHADDEPPAERDLSAVDVLDRATGTVREVGERAPAAEPVTRPVATAVDRAAGDVATSVDELAGSVDDVARRVVDGPVKDTVEDVLAPVVPPAEVEPDAEASPQGPAVGDQPVASAAAAAHGTDREPRRTAPAPRTDLPAPVPSSDPAPAGGQQRTDRQRAPDFPQLDEILGLGAFSGAPGAGSGASGGTAPVATLSGAAVIAAGARLGVVVHADDGLPRTPPRTPGWSPD